MLFRNFRISKNESCPCGSGEKYSRCCHNKSDKVKDSNIQTPAGVRIAEAFRKQLFTCCLYPDKSDCVKQISNAHALQNNKILSKLAVDNHVYMLNPKKAPIIVPVEKNDFEVLTEIDRVGVKNATTYTCFCKIHDDRVFSEIEKGACQFDPNNVKQKFLYAYKAFIFEYYKELVLERVFRKEIKERPTLLKKIDVVMEYRQMTKKRQEMDKYKAVFDKSLISEDYSCVESYVLELPQEIKFANYACIAPDYDFMGNRIKNVGKKDEMNRVFLTIFPEDGKSYLLLSHMKSEISYERFGQQLTKVDIDNVKIYLNFVLPLYSENVVLSPRLWEAWAEETQMAYTFYANRKGNQFFVYNKMMSYILKNITSRKTNLSDGNRGLLDLFI